MIGTGTLTALLAIAGAALQQGQQRPVGGPAAPTLAEEVTAMSAIPSVTGWESDAAAFVRRRLGDLPIETDALGDVVVRLGKGPPERLIACQLDEPGLVVSEIGDDGYLRVRPVGPVRGALAAQFLEGQKVVVGAADSAVVGAVGVRSVHLNGRRTGEPPFGFEDAYVDLGAEDAAGVARLGVRLLDPVAPVRRVVELPGRRLAAPSVATKAACVALADAARRVAVGGSDGSVVFAWTVQGQSGRRGLSHVVQKFGPFADALIADNGFAAAAPRANVGLDDARVGYVGLPARYADTPVETVAMSDVAALSDAFVAAAGVSRRTRATAPPLAALPPLALLVRGGTQTPGSAAEIEPGGMEAASTPADQVAAILARLVGRYGVSGDEGPVRDAVRSLLPGWARPRIDSAGNVSIDFGEGAEHEVFIAHMDEVGFVVDTIRADGTLVLSRRGGLYPSLWEGQAALVHARDRSIPGVFEPRPGWREADRREPPGALTVWVGAASVEEARSLGVRVGATVTMPKRMLRLGENRVVARGLDDRAGSTALLLAARTLDPTAIHRRITFAWVVREEVGLLGSAALAAHNEMHDAARAYAVDTFVSSDAPLESRRIGFARLGSGAVVRAVDSSTMTPLPVVDDVLRVAALNEIPATYGTTNGGTDATPFVVRGAIPVPLSWPGRYSHSPVEVADLRDIASLASLIQALVTRP